MRIFLQQLSKKQGCLHRRNDERRDEFSMPISGHLIAFCMKRIEKSGGFDHLFPDPPIMGAVQHLKTLPLDFLGFHQNHLRIGFDLFPPLAEIGGKIFIRTLLNK